MPPRFFSEIDRVNKLLNANKVKFQTGDFQEALIDMQSDDFVFLHPPYPDSESLPAEMGQIYTKIFSNNVLFELLKKIVQRMEKKDVDYIMPFVYYHPSTRRFLIRDQSGKIRNYFYLLGYPDCTHKQVLDQIYMSPNFSIPKHLQSKIIHASAILQDAVLTSDEAFNRFITVSKNIESE